MICTYICKDMYENNIHKYVRENMQQICIYMLKYALLKYGNICINMCIQT